MNEKDKAKKKRKKAVAAILGDAVAAVALKDSKFNKRGEIGSLHSARRLARDLFENLGSIDPERKELTVEGMLQSDKLWTVLRFYGQIFTRFSRRKRMPALHLACLTRTEMAISLRRKCAKPCSEFIVSARP